MKLPEKDQRVLAGQWAHCSESSEGGSALVLEVLGDSEELLAEITIWL